MHLTISDFTSEWKLIEQEEGGDRDKVYLDHLRKPTAGIGHLLSSRQRKKYPKDSTVPDSVREQWWLKDRETALADAQWFLTDCEPNHSVTRIITHMAFQIGRTKLAQFVSLRAALESKSYDLAVVEMIDSKWATQTPPRVVRLAQRMRRVT